MEEFLKLIAAQFGGFAGKKVLDVGTDVAGKNVQTMAEYFDPREVVGVNIAIEDKVFDRHCRVERQDIRKTSYADNQWDLVFSSSAFEHIQELDIAMAEMHRILRPGGYLYTHFGPIWSCSFGHHLWLTHNGVLINYHNCLLPPWCHLLMSKDELAALVSQQLDRQLTQKIVEFVFHSGEQNQLMFDDYKRIFDGSAFKQIFFKGYDDPKLNKKYQHLITAEAIQQLKRKYPGHDNFMYSGITALMQKV